MAKTNKPNRSPAREALATEIEAAAKLAAAAENAAAAVARAEELVAKTKADLYEAQVRLREAKESAKANAMALASGGDDLRPVGPLRGFRDAAADAEEAHAAAVAVLADLKEAAVDPEVEQRRAQARIKHLADAVVLAEVQRLRDEAEALALPLAEKLSALRSIASEVDFFKNGAAIQKLGFFDTYFRFPEAIVRQAEAAGAPWREALAALAVDADAELPK